MNAQSASDRRLSNPELCTQLGRTVLQRSAAHNCHAELVLALV